MRNVQDFCAGWPCRLKVDKRPCFLSNFVVPLLLRSEMHVLPLLLCLMVSQIIYKVGDVQWLSPLQGMDGHAVLKVDKRDV